MLLPEHADVESMDFPKEMLMAFPAKTTEDDSKRTFGISVYQHNLLTGYVFLALRDTFQKPDDGLPRSLACLAASHDIGKVNPGFLRKLLLSLSEEGLPPTEKSKWEKLIADAGAIEEVSHPIVSYAALKTVGVEKRIAALAAMHHGYPPPATVASDSAWLYGGPAWGRAREMLLQLLMEKLGVTDFPKRNTDREKQKVLSDVWLGFVIVSDWIASQIDKPLPPGTEKTAAEELVCKAGFKRTSILGDLSFENVFGFHMRPAQQMFSELYAGPGIYVFEAPTGYGKTEAALWLAYKALQSGDASGIYFSLPTQLTSTRLYDRFCQYVGQISQSKKDAVQLIHGGVYVHRQRNYEADMLKGHFGKEGAPGGSWFSANRRAILAPFGVGTIDQALLSELNAVRFSSIRAAGLFGKVVIFDEVHSYDAYTSSLLKELLKRLLKIDAVVIILSATLTQGAKQYLLGCSSELEEAEQPISFTRKLVDEESPTINGLAIRQEDSKGVEFKLLEWEKTAEAFDEALRRVRRGEQVLWIENDVSSAQKCYDKFKSVGVDCGLLHSRFRPIEREVLEDKWTRIFGKFSGTERCQHGRILIGTQILEQSLDIDADFLVTRLAPIDLLIQRTGRLWRHSGTVRPLQCSVPAAWVLAGPSEDCVSVDRSLAAQFGPSAYVYSPPYYLYRTLEMLKRRLQGKNVLQLPDEVRGMLEEVYRERGEETVPEAEGFRRALMDHRDKLEALSRGVLSFVGGEDDASVDPSTRYIDRPMREVLVVESLDELVDVPQAEVMLWAERRIVKTSMACGSLPLVREMNSVGNGLLRRLQTAPRFHSVFFLDASSSPCYSYTKEKGLFKGGCSSATNLDA